MFRYTLIPIALILFLLASWVLYIGLRGFITKKPVVFSTKPLFWLMALCYLPSVLLQGAFLFDRREFEASDLVMPFLMVAIYALVLAMFWRIMQGYSVIGVNDDSFRDALHFALNQLGLPFEETLSKVKLTSLGVDLEPNISSGLGVASVKIKQGRQHGDILRKIADAMREYFASHNVPVNWTTSVFYTILGVILLAMLAFMLVQASR